MLVTQHRADRDLQTSVRSSQGLGVREKSEREQTHLVATHVYDYRTTAVQQCTYVLCVCVFSNLVAFLQRLVYNVSRYTPILGIICAAARLVQRRKQVTGAFVNS